VRELRKPGAVDVGTRFAIGSTTKAMTAVALGVLVDEGKGALHRHHVQFLRPSAAICGSSLSAS
jgi:CubicO group peptidase (beta-lactamase class C family)